MDIEGVTMGAAFLAGILSIFSPCVLPLVPAYIAQLSSAASNQDENIRNRDIFMQAFIFIVGFSAVFIVLGMVSSLIGQFLNVNRQLLLRIMGLLVVLLGLNLMGLLRFHFFIRQWQPLRSIIPNNAFRSFFLGVAFAMGWTPCIGPILAAIMTLAATSGSVYMGALLLLVYSLGMAVPFLLLAFTFDRIAGLNHVLRKYSRVSLWVSGFFLIVLGVLMFFDKFGVLAGYLTF